ncbi:MAG TPA: phosphoribosylformylglycinamidine synthase subunit PurL [bacterium]|nr:phosphoribosylformylglycinamidine synthase subunit PurL [bacterium]
MTVAVEQTTRSVDPLAGTKLTAAEFDEICRRLGRSPNQAELAMFGVMWSEHCAYKHSKTALKRLPTLGRRVLRGPGENAGAVLVGDGWAAVFKMESHNHPSAVAPFHGAATGVGGIIRDILAMGARPVALLDSLRFGPPEEPGVPPLLDGVVAGIAAYGNSIGVPTVGGELSFAPCYRSNPLVNVACLGIARADRLATARAAGPGNPVVYLGARTGRDGIHGASFASAELGGDPRDRSAVQMGDPFTGKLLIEASLEALASGAVVAIQDMGAAGLTCAVSEMSSRGGVGMEIDLGLVPRREEGMTAEEVLLSESQERMLLVVGDGREDEVLHIGRRWGLQAVVIGRVIGSSRLIVREGDVVVAALDPRTLTEAPVYAPPSREPAYLADVRRVVPSTFPVAPPHPTLLALLASPNIADSRWVFRQYDHMVQTNTVVPPGADAAVLRLKDAFPRGLALAVDGNGRHGYLDPYLGGMLAVLEAAQNIACVGGTPAAVTDCLNFANPERPEVVWTFREAVEGIAGACEALGIPIVGGNVSFYNEADDAIFPTSVIAMLGVLEDVRRHATPGWKRDGDLIVLLGGGGPQLEGSEYLAVVHGVEAGRLRHPDPTGTACVIQCTREAVSRGLVSSAHDCALGGMAVALAECCIAGGLGAAVALPVGRGQRSDVALFGESVGRILVSVPPPRLTDLMHLAARLAVPARVLGSVGGARLIVGADGDPARGFWIDADVLGLARAWRGGEGGRR